jgi:hypothetical protein
LYNSLTEFGVPMKPVGLIKLCLLNIGITSVSNKVFFGARFYCALLTLHVSVSFGGHLQVVRKHKKYLR